MSKGIFDRIVIIQDKTLTGSWKPMTLFFLMFFSVIGIIILMKKINKQEYLIENVVKSAIQVAIISVIVNYITGKLFTSREKMYKTKGFSNKSSKGQAYADARLGQFVAAVGGGMI